MLLVILRDLKRMYEDYYWTQSTSKRFRLNELTIWAVNKMVDSGSHTSGSKDFLRTRQDQLIKDLRIEGWRRASKRFRDGVNQWIRNRCTV
jgi:hypothetical protein